MAAPKHRNWVFTLNNYTDDERNVIDTFVTGFASFLVYQPEIGESGTKHLQGLVIFTHARSLDGVRILFAGRPSLGGRPRSGRGRLGAFVGLLEGAGRRAVEGESSTEEARSRAHFEPMRGTAEQAEEYCTKEETRDANAGFGVFRFGDRPVGQGDRSDLRELALDIRSGKRGRELFEEHASAFLRYHRGIAHASSFYEGARSEPTAVHWFWGSTGTGKSRAVFETCGDAAYWKNPTDYWWDGYSGQDDVVIDDYRKDFCKFSDLLRLFDRYPLRLQVKGGTVSFVAKRIFVTCPNPPDVVWAGRTEEDLQQLTRRITEVKFFSADLS